MSNRIIQKYMLSSASQGGASCLYVLEKLLSHYAPNDTLQSNPKFQLIDGDESTIYLSGNKVGFATTEDSRRSGPAVEPCDTDCFAITAPTGLPLTSSSHILFNRTPDATAISTGFFSIRDSSSSTTSLTEVSIPLGGNKELWMVGPESGNRQRVFGRPFTIQNIGGVLSLDPSSPFSFTTGPTSITLPSGDDTNIEYLNLSYDDLTDIGGGISVGWTTPSQAINFLFTPVP